MNASEGEQGGRQRQIILALLIVKKKTEMAPVDGCAINRCQPPPAERHKHDTEVPWKTPTENVGKQWKTPDNKKSFPAGCPALRCREGKQSAKFDTRKFFFSPSAFAEKLFSGKLIIFENN